MKRIMLLIIVFYLAGCSSIYYKEKLQEQITRYGPEADSVKMMKEKGAPVKAVLYERWLDWPHEPGAEYDQIVVYKRAERPDEPNIKIKRIEKHYFLKGKFVKEKTIRTTYHFDDEGFLTGTPSIYKSTTP